MAVTGDTGAAGGDRGVPGASVRGHEFVRHPCQEGHYHAEGYTACEEDTGDVGGTGVEVWLKSMRSLVLIAL